MLLLNLKLFSAINCTVISTGSVCSRSREEECDRQLEKLKQRDQLAKAAKSFWRSLRNSDLDMDGVITLTEFKRAMKAVCLNSVQSKHNFVKINLSALQTNKQVHT